MRTIGLDVHKRFAEIAILEPGHKEARRRRLAITPAALRDFAITLGPEDQVVLEATTNTWAIAELLGRPRRTRRGLQSAPHPRDRGGQG